MQRTLYTDGVEVDQSDLGNTESTKIAEILLTRRTLGDYGVIEGLSVSVVGDAVRVGVGKLAFPNGEIVELAQPLEGQAGAAFDAGVWSYVGLRLVEAKSRPKPHETDSATYLTRASTQVKTEFFVATAATQAARDAALTLAISAETSDLNFVLIGLVNGTGTGIERVRGVQHPRTQGGDQPFNTATKTDSQLAGLGRVYTPDDEFPIHSARDEYHRSLIGGGAVTASNPHGLTLKDIGGEGELAGGFTNGLVGFAPTESDFQPDSGSLAFEVIGGFSPQVSVLGLQGTDLLVIRGAFFDKSAVGNTSIDFSAKGADFYYIVAKYGTDIGLTIDAVSKSSLDASCQMNAGSQVWLNSARELSGVSGELENKFFVIGLVRWDGASTFLSFTADVQLPAPNGRLAYRTSFPVSHPLFLPTGQTRIDLRRWGLTSGENVQRRSVALDRLAFQVTPEGTFRLHSGMGPGGEPVVGQGLRADASQKAAGEDVTLRHLTNRDAWLLFGHRGNRGLDQHLAAQPDVNDSANLAGFQSALDKWRQENLTMTIFKWSDIRGLGDATAARSMGDAAATASGGDTGLKYVVCRSGYITNVACHLGTAPASGVDITISLQIGDDPAIGVALFHGSGGDDQTAAVYTGRIAVTATPSAPVAIRCIHTLTGSGGSPKNLTATVEFHYQS